MDIATTKIFKIDNHQSEVEIINQATLNTDFESYLIGLIDLITKGSSGRNFHFERDTTEVRGAISRLIEGGDFHDISTSIAKRLLSIEQKTQIAIAKLNKEIQKGILVQALVTENSVQKFVICKADHNEFLDEIQYARAKGLPLKKKVFKAFICSILPDQSVTDVLVFDTNPDMSRYWWRDFLELAKVHSDEDNTVNAFDAIDKGVFTKIKKEYPQDYLHLRNATVRYFRGSDHFVMQDYLDNAIGNYEPYNPKLNVTELKAKIQSLPKASKKKFDEQFDIVKSMINARFIHTVNLTTEIDLILKQNINNLESVITAEQSDDGTKYVKIKSDMGYRYFKDLKTRTD